MNMNFKRKLPIPQEIKAEYPLSQELAASKAKTDAEIAKVFKGESDKFILVIVKPFYNRDYSAGKIPYRHRNTQKINVNLFTVTAYRILNISIINRIDNIVVLRMS